MKEKVGHWILDASLTPVFSFCLISLEMCKHSNILDVFVTEASEDRNIAHITCHYSPYHQALNPLYTPLTSINICSPKIKLVIVPLFLK